MEKRTSINEIEPKAFKAMYVLEEYLRTSNVSKEHKHLVKMRASQINGCAYCIEMHAAEAFKIGEKAERLLLLNAWRESSYFTAEEKAILALTEEVTLIHQHGVSDAVYQQIHEFFDEHYVAQLVMAIVTINAWNRISVTSRSEFS